MGKIALYLAGMASAISTKSVDAAGDQRVLTVANSATASAGAPAEPTKSILAKPAPFGVKCRGRGTEIGSVVKGSQAEKAGVVAGWIVLTVAGKKVSTAQDVTKALAEAKRAGKEYKVVLKPLAAPAASTAIEPATAATAGGGGKKDAGEAAAAAAAAEEAARKEAEDAAAAAAAAAEAGNGEVVLHYSMYSESFPIVNGSIGAAKIDEDYCLSDSMPGCEIHLSKVKTDFKGGTLKAPELLDLSQVGNPYVEEDGAGNFLGLDKTKEYWVYVTEDSAQEALDREKMAAVVAATIASDPTAAKSEYAEAGLPESCSCIVGNTFVD
jgi:hypothetical protein